MQWFAFCRPGSDLLSRVLRQSTIGAGAFHGRVRNGNGCSHPARTTRSAKRNAINREAGGQSPFEFVFVVLISNMGAWNTSGAKLRKARGRRPLLAGPSEA